MDRFFQNIFEDIISICNIRMRKRQNIDLDDVIKYMKRLKLISNESEFNNLVMEYLDLKAFDTIIPWTE